MRIFLNITAAMAVSAVALGSAGAARAQAECQAGMTEVYTNEGGEAVFHCVTVGETGEGGAVTGQIVPTGETLEDADGNPHGISEYVNPTAEVHGENGLAAGNGSKVGTGRLVEAVDPSCTNGASVASGGGCRPYRPVDGICANGNPAPRNGLCTDAVYTAGTPAHWEDLHTVSEGTAVGASSSVQHDHSTALGAGSASTDDHQVTLGTGEDTLRAPGVTSQKSKDRQSGALQVLTTDEDGHVASDGGQIFETLDNHEGRIKGNSDKNDEQDSALADHEGRIKGNSDKNDEQDSALIDHEGRIKGNSDKNDEQDSALIDHEGRIKGNSAKNDEQDKTLSEHGTRITTVERRADDADDRLNHFNGSSNSVEAWGTGVDGALTSLQDWRQSASSDISALQTITVTHTAQIRQLQNEMKDLRGGVALAMALTVPHVDPGNRLALTISGAGYDDTGAISAAAALRISNHTQAFVGAGTAFRGGPAAVKGGLTFQW